MTKAFEKLLKDYELHCKKVEQSTTIRLNESPADKMKRIKKTEQDYAEWFEYYFPLYA